jgi:hypothetical protein
MQFGQTLSVIEEAQGGYPPVLPIRSAYLTIEIDEGLNGHGQAEGWVFGDLALYINKAHLHVLVHLPSKVEIYESHSCSATWMVKVCLIRIGADIKKMIDDRRYAHHVMRIMSDFLDVETIQGFLL